MTEEQILELVKEHFEEDWDEVDGWEYSGNFDAFVKFAHQSTVIEPPPEFQPYGGVKAEWNETGDGV